MTLLPPAGRTPNWVEHLGLWISTSRREWLARRVLEEPHSPNRIHQLEEECLSIPGSSESWQGADNCLEISDALRESPIELLVSCGKVQCGPPFAPNQSVNFATRSLEMPKLL
jgi:hypothetical protein